MGGWRQYFGLLHLLVIALMSRRNIALIAVAAFVLAAMLDPRPNRMSNQQVFQQSLSIDNQVANSDEPITDQYHAELIWKTQTVASGDNLSTIFQRAGLSALEVYFVSKSEQGKALTNLFPGETLRFGIDSTSGDLIEMHYEKTALETHIFKAQEKRFDSKKIIREPEIITSYREGTIEQSLYLAGKKAKLPDKTIMELANIFGWDIDFVFDIREGDSFALLFEEHFIDGRRLATGNILAASFSNRGKIYNAIRYKNSQGVSSYFTPDGLSMRKAFLRTPLDIFRISSGFNLRRKHPIHKKIKAHRGVDYAAPTGTPVYTTGDGKVIEAGYTKPNGNYVIIQHGQTYTTKYLHLHRKKVRTGQTVRQRQVIGTVGATGYATGPHLHYEFLVNGVHRNPRTVALPKANPIPNAEKDAFSKRAAYLLAQLADFQQASQLALNIELKSQR